LYSDFFFKKKKGQQIIKDGDNALCAKMINYTRSIAKEVLGDILYKSNSKDDLIREAIKDQERGNI
jgi:hypothetical protein